MRPIDLGLEPARIGAHERPDHPHDCRPARRWRALACPSNWSRPRAPRPSAGAGRMVRARVPRSRHRHRGCRVRSPRAGAPGGCSGSSSSASSASTATHRTSRRRRPGPCSSRPRSCRSTGQRRNPVTAGAAAVPADLGDAAWGATPYGGVVSALSQPSLRPRQPPTKVPRRFAYAAECRISRRPTISAHRQLARPPDSNCPTLHRTHGGSLAGPCPSGVPAQGARRYHPFVEGGRASHGFRRSWCRFRAAAAELSEA